MRKETPPDALDSSLIAGIAWTAGAKWGVQLLTWPLTLLVARQLSPGDYGLVAMAAVSVRAMSLLAEGGFGSAIAVAPTIARTELIQVHSLCFAMGLTACALTWGLAPFIGAFYESPGVVPIARVLAIVFVFDSLAVAPAGFIRRTLRFRELALLESLRSCVDAFTGLMLALTGFGYWSLVGGYLAGAAVWSMSILVLHPVPLRIPAYSQFSQILATSVHFLTRNVAGFACSVSDILIAGRILGDAAVGMYSFANTLASMPVDKITATVTRVTPSLFAEAAHDTVRLRRYYMWLIKTVSLATYPALIGAILVAPDALPLILGQQWSQTVVPFQILCAHGLSVSTLAFVPHIMQVTGHARAVTRQSIVALLLLPPAFYMLGSSWGANGIALAWLVVFPLTMAPTTRLACRIVGVSFRDMVREIRPAALSCGSMAAVVISFRMYADLAEVPTIITVLASILLGVVTYGCSLLAFRSDIRQVVKFIRSARAK